LSNPVRQKLVYIDSNLVTIRAKSFSGVKGARLDGKSEFRDAVGAEFAMFKPIPTTKSKFPDE
jgi:hypothetical protein